MAEEKWKESATAEEEEKEAEEQEAATAPPPPPPPAGERAAGNPREANRGSPGRAALVGGVEGGAPELVRVKVVEEQQQK